MKNKILEQHVFSQGSLDPHINRMGLIEDVQVKEGILPEGQFIGARFSQSVLDKTDSVIPEINAGKTLFPAAFYNLCFPYVNALDKVIPLQKGTEKNDPDNDKSDAECILGKCQGEYLF